MLKAVDLSHVRKINNHLGLSKIKENIENKLNDKFYAQQEKLIFKLALQQIQFVEDALEHELITEEEISEMLVDYREVDEILNL